MLMHSRLLSYIVLLLSIVSFGHASQSDLTGDDFIQRLLYCAPYDVEYRKASMFEHYFGMFTLKGKAAPADSFYDIARSAELMLEEWHRSTTQMMATFREEYLNLNLYTNRFVDDRFNPMVNLVWTELAAQFSSPERFTDWAEKRDFRMTFNQFTNLVDSQKNLILEFSEMNESLVETWTQNAPNLTGEIEINTGEAFTFMKSETVAYLGMIFMNAFEFNKDTTFYTEDNVLEEYWRVFLPWLNMDQCNRLVNAAFNGMLPKVTNRQILDKLMNSNIQAQNMDTLRLVFDNDSLTAFSQVMPEGAFLQKLGGKWSFYNEANLNEIIDLTEDDSVDERIEFDKIRLESIDNCLEFIATLESFTSMKDVLKKRQLYMVENYYYYFIEYLNLRIKDTNEFPDQLRAKRAVQIIYMFMNRILNEDKDVMTKQGPGDNIVRIILRILNGLSPTGNLREIPPTDLLDEVTENYIYMLFFIVTESNPLPKPGHSDELDRARDNSVIDEDEEPDFKIDPRNPKYAYIIKRLYQLAGNSSSAGMKYVKRYHKKYFNEDLLRKNLIFAMDDQFYKLELQMSQEFTDGDYGFDGGKAAYEEAKQVYFQQAMKGKNNMHVHMLVKYFTIELQKFKALTPPSDCSDPKQWKKNKYDELFLSHLAELKSNFMEMQYVEAILFTHKKFNVPLPDFEFLLANKMKNDDKMNLFEFMKRVISNMKHGRSQNRSILLDTVDVNQSLYQDNSAVENGERFHTMLLDVTHFFRPEMERLVKAGHTSSNAKLEYSDLNETMRNLDQQFDVLKKQPETVELRNFRLMMTWNIFDDIEEYMPLLGKFIEETKSEDMQGSNSLKMEMIVENYTNLYIAILEHRLFAGKWNFSFESAEGRAANLLAYLNFLNAEYEEMFNNPLPAKEVRFSKLDSRQVQNLIYFLTYRLKVIEEQITQEVSQIKLSHVYFPYSFREIYVLIDNHQDLRAILESECEQFMETFENEKSMRATDYQETLFDEETRALPGFKFCMLIRFNRDMIGLIESQAENNSRKSIMLTITREAIFQELVVPFYDKLNAHELIIQVFNLNMSHAKAVARESAEKFSNYIALLDAFILILDDLEDGVNDTLNVENMGSGEVSETLKAFCLELEKTDEPTNRTNNLVFIRHMLLEKLNPKFLAPGGNLRRVFDEFTALPVDKSKINKYSGKLRYGPIKGSKVIDLNVEGQEVDNELVAMLMIYSPHSEFTAELLYDNNFMSKLPKYLRMAEDNTGFLYKYYPSENSMDEVFATAYKRKMDTIKQVEDEIDTEVNLTLDDEFDFDMNFMGDEDDQVMNQANSMWESEIIEVTQSDMESNIERVDQVSKILVGQEVIKVQLDSQNSGLENQTVFVDEIIKKTTTNGDEMNELLSSMEDEFANSKMNINGLKVVADSLDFAENSLETKNFVKLPSKGDKSKTIIQDHNTSLMQDFASQVQEDRINTQVGSVCKFKISINNVGDQSQLLALKNAANKIASQMNVDNYKVNVTSSKVTTSHKLQSKMVSHVSQEVRAFDTANKELHISGSHDAKIKMVEGGIVMPIEINSTKFNGAMNNSVEAKSQIKDIIAKGITNIASKSATYTEKSKTQKVVVKSSSRSSNFLRLV